MNQQFCPANYENARKISVLIFEMEIKVPVTRKEVELISRIRADQRNQLKMNADELLRDTAT